MAPPSRDGGRDPDSEEATSAADTFYTVKWSVALCRFSVCLRGTRLTVAIFYALAAAIFTQRATFSYWSLQPFGNTAGANRRYVPIVTKVDDGSSDEGAAILIDTSADTQTAEQRLLSHFRPAMATRALLLAVLAVGALARVNVTNGTISIPPVASRLRHRPLLIADLASIAHPGISDDVNALVAWANGNCANAQGWECAEFTARAIAAGGYIPGLRCGPLAQI